MKIREPRVADAPFILECMADWPFTERAGHITLDKVERWIRMWRRRSIADTCWIAESDEADVAADRAPASGERIGFEVYYIDGDTVVVHNLVVHPDYRGRGYSHRIMAACWETVPPEVTKGRGQVVSDSVLASSARAEKAHPEGRYRYQGDAEGETGTLLVVEAERDQGRQA